MEIETKYSDFNFRSTGARNDYILALASANAHQERYFKHDLQVKSGGRPSMTAHHRSASHLFSLNSSIRGQFHQHFTSSFYTCRSQKRQRDSQVKQLFALLGSVSVKAAHKHVDEVDPYCVKYCIKTIAMLKGSEKCQKKCQVLFLFEWPFIACVKWIWQLGLRVLLYLLHNP